MLRHPDVKVKADYNKEQFAKAVSDWSKDQRAKRIQLEGIKKEVSGVASDKGKKEVLLKHNYLRVGQGHRRVIDGKQHKNGADGTIFGRGGV